MASNRLVAGTIIEVNVSELGLVTQTGKVIFAKYAQAAVKCLKSDVLGANLVTKLRPPARCPFSPRFFGGGFPY